MRGCFWGWGFCHKSFRGGRTRLLTLPKPGEFRVGEQSASCIQAGRSILPSPSAPPGWLLCMKGKPQIPKFASSGAMDALSILLSASPCHSSLRFYFFPSTSLVSTNPEVQLLHSPLALQYFRPKIAVGLEKGRARPEPQEIGAAAAPGEQPAVGTAGWAPTATLSIILPSQPRAGGVKVTLGSKAPSAGSRI